jgi:predicted transcriptional regulator
VWKAIECVVFAVGNLVSPTQALLRTPEFIRVSQLVPEDQDVLTVPVGTRVEQALHLMKTHDFDQLPVTTAKNRIVGAFTYRSLAGNLQHIRRQDGPLTVPVDDLVEELHFVRASQEVGAIVEHLEADHAVLVGDEDRLLAIVTTIDLNRFLWRRTHPFLLLQEIELGVRDLMRSSCSAAELDAAVSAALSTDHGAATRRLEDLTMGELFSVLLNGSSFGRLFRLRFGSNRNLVRVTLEPVCDIRNKVVHFRDDVSAEELQKLIEVAAWLRRKVLIRGGEQ